MFRPVLAIFRGAVILEGTRAFTVLVIGICPEPVLTSPGNAKAFVPFGMYIFVPLGMAKIGRNM
jgi:hypothetical protein